MAGRDPVEVTAQVDGREVAAGTLWIHDRSGQSATFRYADSYLAERGSYDLDRALPKAAGVFHTPPGSDNPALLSTAIDFDDTTASIDVALAVCGHFRLSRSAARRLMGDVASDIEMARCRQAAWAARRGDRAHDRCLRDRPAPRRPCHDAGLIAALGAGLLLAAGSTAERLAG